jgi:hypothetical protein
MTIITLTILIAIIVFTNSKTLLPLIILKTLSGLLTQTNPTNPTNHKDPMHPNDPINPTKTVGTNHRDASQLLCIAIITNNSSLVPLSRPSHAPLNSFSHSRSAFHFTRVFFSSPFQLSPVVSLNSGVGMCLLVLISISMTQHRDSITQHQDIAQSQVPNFDLSAVG